MKLFASICLAGLWLASTAVAAELEPQLRYPCALVRLDARTLAVLNARSGTLSLVDLERRSVRRETRIGQRPTALAQAGRWLLVADAEARALTAWKAASDGTLAPGGRLQISPDPLSIATTSDGRRALVVSGWSRRLECVSVAEDGTLALEFSLPLPFPARRLQLLPGDQHLVVTDAFGGGVALVDLERRAIANVRDLGGHNIYGLAWDSAGERLLVAHQILSSPLPVTLDNIQWGALLKNVVRIVPRKQLFDPQANLATATRVVSLGQEGDGSADPTAVVPLADGGFAVTLGGADELVIVESTGLVTRRLALGRRPLALLAGERQLVALNQFDSTLSLVDVAEARATATISLGPAPALTATERGERLFYDARLSFEKWMSCHSCHTEGHTHGLNADTLGDNSFGAPKRTLTLLGTRDTDRWAWNGEIKELHEQVRKSIETSMQGTALAQDVYDLTAYLHTLQPPPPLLPAPQDQADRKLLELGRQEFERQRCGECHIGPLTYTSHDVYDVHLEDENGLRKFNPPSLRGVGQASRLLHDGRATSLEDVFDVYGHQVDEPLTGAQRAALLRFLRSL